MHKFYDEVSKITPNLYLTNGYSIHASGLSKLGINLVINVTKDLDFQTKNSEGAIINARVPVDDNVQANLLPYFQVHTYSNLPNNCVGSFDSVGGRFLEN